MTFYGEIIDGRGTYVELGVPGRTELPEAPAAWPQKLCPGSLNLKVAADGYPEEFLAAEGQNATIKLLDSGFLPPYFKIDQERFVNNKLTPTPQLPNRGDAQVWRAELTHNGTKIDCWVLRRIGSGLGRELEILSDKHLRNTYGIKSGDKVSITLFSDGGAA